MMDETKYILTMDTPRVRWPAAAPLVAGPAASPPPYRPAADPVDTYTALPEGPAAGGGGGTELRRLHQMMRGRYLLAVALAAALGAAGGYAGFRAGRTTYASLGQVRFKPYLPAVLHSTDENGQLPAFDSFVEAQVALLKSQRVADLAMQDPAWAGLGRGRSDQAMAAYMKAVTVTKDGDLIQIQAVDPDPASAVTEVRTLVAAYQKLYNEEDAQGGERRLDVLQSLQANRSNEMATLRQRILDVAKVYGSSDLKGLYQFKQDQVNRLEATIADRQMELTTATRTGPTGQAGPADLPRDPSPEQWARYSPQMAKLVDERDGYQQRVDELLATGSGRSGSAVQTSQKLAELQDRRIAELSDRLRAARAEGWVPTPVGAAGGPATGAGAAGGGVDVNALREDIGLLQKRLDKAQAEMVAVGKQSLDIQELQAQFDQVRQERDEAQRRIEQLNLESTISGRIQVISNGDHPLGPYKDTHVTLAAAGGGGGALLGFGLVAALAALDRRLRNPDEAGTIATGHGGGAVLGLLPRLPENLSDPTEAAIAAHCVNEVRTSLQLWGRHGRHRVYAITSPGAGAGKTSLTLALGVSYATAKLRTLIVDCDLVGGGLTTRVDQIVNQRLGQVLCDLGLLTDAQRAAALEQSRTSGRRLGAVLVEAGLMTDEQIERAVAVQAERPVGIVDALHGTPLAACTAEVGIPNLHVLSAGGATGRDVPLLSSHAMQELVEQMRRAYDVVLIDTGPILGSLEAQLVSALADGVVLTVTKGASRPLVARSLAQLAGMGARVAGVVFNRASTNDVTIYGSSTSNRGRSLSLPPDGHLPPPPADAGRAAKFGPLAVAVAQFSPVSKPA